MKQWISERFYRPMLFFFLLPIFYLILGNIFALQYETFKVIGFMLLYLFVLVNQMLENMLLRIPKNDFEISKPFFSGLEFLNIVLLVYFGFRYSWLAALVLLFYTLIIQIQFVFSYYDLEYIIVFVATFLKLVLLNGFSFYTQTNFIHPRFIPIYLGLFIPFYLFEVSRTDRKLKNIWLFSMVACGYNFSFFFLWGYIGWKSLFLLLSLPFASLFRAGINRKSSSIFVFIFSFTYIILSLLTLVN